MEVVHAPRSHLNRINAPFEPDRKCLWLFLDLGLQKRKGSLFLLPLSGWILWTAPSHWLYSVKMSPLFNMTWKITWILLGIREVGGGKVPVAHSMDFYESRCLLATIHHCKGARELKAVQSAGRINWINSSQAPQPSYLCVFFKKFWMRTGNNRKSWPVLCLVAPF